MAAQIRATTIGSGADYWPELGHAVKEFGTDRHALEPMPDDADLMSIQVEQLLLRLLAELVDDTQLRGRTTQIALPAMLARYQALFAASPRPAFPIAQEIKALFDTVRLILAAHRRELRGALGAERRQVIGQLLRQSTRAYHWDCERRVCSGRFGELPTMHVLDLLTLAQQYSTCSTAPSET